MYVFDYEYLIPATDSGECDCLQKPVRECESDGNCGYGGEYGGSDGVL